MATPTQKSFLTRHRLKLVGGYLLLLALSWLTQAGLRPAPSPPLDMTPGFPGRDLLVLVDPIDPSAEALLRSVRDLMDDGYGVRAPLLPGINRADGPVRDLRELADSIPPRGFPETVIANGQAGDVALHYTAARPERVRGLVLVNAEGVQEFSLLGEYHLNHGLYVVSDAALTLFDRLAPHFGLWPRLGLRRAQVELLRRSDRRELRPLFSEITHPALIIQHAGDEEQRFQALEHARLLPQSRHVALAASESMGPGLESFLKALEGEGGVSRENAPMERLTVAGRAFDAGSRPRPSGHRLMLILFALALATLITEDLTCAVTGLMIASGTLTWAQGVGACLSGILFGDYLLFLAGRIWGRPALNRVPLRWMIDPVTLRETEEWFNEKAGKAILISRCLPGTRLPAYVAAGILGVPVRIFTAWFVLAGLIWTPLFVTVSAALSSQALEWIDRYHHTAPALLVAGVLLYLLFTHVLLPACNRRGRRKLYGKWQRLRRPEYWPPLIFYLPVGVCLLLRSFRKGNRFMDFTACNPCIRGGGVVEESKTGILDQIAEREAIAPYRKLPRAWPAEKKEAAVREFQTEHGVGYPLVLKPDAGQRGAHVAIVRDAERMRAILQTARGGWMAQEYIPGEEYGLFFIRTPEEDRGFIYGITGKAFPSLIGDGIRNLEDLILDDDRAVCQAGMHMRHHAERLYEVPAAGDRIPLTDVGNHARGTVFLEKTHLATPELGDAVNRIADSLPGFHFGRFDLRVPSEEDLGSGRNLKIIELNGVTSESTNMYDPDKRYPEMLRILLGQWKWASRIGKQQRLQGAKLYPMSKILKDYDRQRKRENAYLRETHKPTRV